MLHLGFWLPVHQLVLTVETFNKIVLAELPELLFGCLFELNMIKNFFGIIVYPEYERFPNHHTCVLKYFFHVSRNKFVLKRLKTLIDLYFDLTGFSFTLEITLFTLEKSLLKEKTYFCSY